MAVNLAEEISAQKKGHSGKYSYFSYSYSLQLQKSLQKTNILENHICTKNALKQIFMLFQVRTACLNKTYSPKIAFEGVLKFILVSPEICDQNNLKYILRFRESYQTPLPYFISSEQLQHIQYKLIFNISTQHNNSVKATLNLRCTGNSD